jgi:DNA-binding NtrC family response regulator
MENKNQIHNIFPLINISEVNELVSSIKGNKYIIKIGDTIKYDIIFESINSGCQLSTIIQEITSQIEKYIIINILEHTCWNKSEAARVLKINYKTLYYKMKKYSI